MTPEISNELFLGMLLLALTTLASLTASVVQIIKNSRRQPPTHEVLLQVERSVAERYALRSELRELESKHSANISRVHEKIDALTNTMQAGFRGLERTLGVIEGQLKGSQS